MKRNKESIACMHKIDKKFCIVWIGVLLVFLISCIYRRPYEGEGFYNSDATYHVLLTMEAYEESDISVHSFLPIQTLGAQNNKFINNGPSLVQDANGNSFYVSFSPAGFYAPYLFCKLFHLPLSINSIYIFNCILMLISAVLCAVIVYIVLKKKALSVLAFLAYIFIPEVLMTQGIVYWHHSLSQVFLILQLVIFSVITFARPKTKLPWQILFLLISFLYPYIEWTGFVSNIGFALCVFINGFSMERTETKRLRLSYDHTSSSKMVLLGVTTVASFGYYLWRYSKIAPISIIMNMLSSRASGRSVASYSRLLRGYIGSYKPLLAFTAISVILALIITSSRKKLVEELFARKSILLILAAFFPMLENVVMTEHAIEYTFDRLKFAPLLILILCLAMNALSVADKKLVLATILWGGGTHYLSVWA